MHYRKATVVIPKPDSWNEKTISRFLNCIKSNESGYTTIKKYHIKTLVKCFEE